MTRGCLAMTGLLLVVASKPTVLSAVDTPLPSTPPDATVVVVVGAGGDDEYTRAFAQWADRWEAAAIRGHAEVITVGRSPPATDDLEQVQRVLAAQAGTTGTPLWIVLLGHGTFDGRTAKFNLRGPDMSSTQLADWLAPIHRPVAVVNCAAASGPFVKGLSASGRVIVTATQSGQEVNFARFGDELSAALTNPASDLDKDGQVSLLEAFLWAARATQEYYDAHGRLATEHALLDDDGDGQGTRGSEFQGLRAAPDPKTGRVDGHRARQWHLIASPEETALPIELRQQRDALELAVAQWRDRKSQVPENEYFAELERLLLPLAKLYETVSRGSAPQSTQAAPATATPPPADSAPTAAKPAASK